MAAWFPVLFFIFYLVKNHKIAQYSTTTKAGENISTDLESLEIYLFISGVKGKSKGSQEREALMNGQE